MHPSAFTASRGFIAMAALLGWLALRKGKLTATSLAAVSVEALRLHGRSICARLSSEAR
jgi:hypothetical protein